MGEETVSAELLKEKGYSEYKEDCAEFGHRFFQKKVSDDLGIRYFIDCKFIYFSNRGKQMRFWDFSITIETPHGHVNISTVQWFNQDGIDSGNSIEDVEDYFETMWNANNKPYYERWGSGE